MKRRVYSVISHADDTTVICRWYLTKCDNKTKKEIIFKTGPIKHNTLSLNVSKTVCKHFDNYKDSICVIIIIKLKIDGELIKRVPSIKYSCIFVDCYFRWNVEIISRVSKAKYLIYILSRLSKLCTPENL